MTAILIADDHPLFRQALAVAAAEVAPGATLLEAGTLDAALALLADHADVALACLDLNMPGAAGYSGVAMVHAERPGLPILVVSGAEPARAAAESARYGAVGFVGKDGDARRARR
jgi:DNA-binding NarL/FixJ family response regulator